MKMKLMNLVIIAFLSYIVTPSLIYSQEKPKSGPQPLQAGVPADSDAYIIGPEDVIHIYVWKEDSITKTVPVRMDGKISIPLIDDVHAAGLTPLQLKEILVKKLKAFIDNPTVSVTVLEANSFKVYVSGEVRQPGIQRIRSECTLAKIIAMSGGFTDWANKKKILIIRNDGKKRLTVNYNKIIEGKAEDIIIERGDMVVVQ